MIARSIMSCEASFASSLVITSKSKFKMSSKSKSMSKAS
jgi:hypothetical protein